MSDWLYQPLLPSVDLLGQTTVEPGFIEGTQVFAPTLLQDQVAEPGFIEPATQVFAPMLAQDGVALPGFIEAETEVFSPQLAQDQTVEPGFIASTSQCFAPTIVNVAFDTLHFHHSGAASDGAAQADPDACLGGFRASHEVQSLAVLGAIERVTIERLGEGHAEPGSASLYSDGESKLSYTAPGSASAGPLLTVRDDGEPYYLPDGADPAKALRVTRQPGDAFPPLGQRTLKLLDVFNNLQGMSNAADAERAAGNSRYRMLVLQNHGAQDLDLTVWLGAQGAARTVGGAGYAASGAVTITVAGCALHTWPRAGFVENQDTGEVLYYASRTDSTLSVPAAGRDVFAEVGGGDSGAADDELYPVSGLRLALEEPDAQPDGEFQTIADDETAPTGLTWRHPVADDDADVLTRAALEPGQIVGLWIERAHVAGAAAQARALNHISISAAAGQTYTYHLRGLFRLAEDALAGYELFRGVDSEPDLTGSPWETFTSLPHETAALDPEHTYYFVLRKRNEHDLSSQNVASWQLTVDAGGAAVDAPSAPAEWLLEAAADGAGRITARYDYLLDDEAVRGTHWAVWFTTDGSAPDPTDPADYEEAIVLGDGMAKLDWTGDPNAHGTTLKGLVRVRRIVEQEDPDPDLVTDSTNTEVQTISADANGPAAPTGQPFLGQAYAQA